MFNRKKEALTIAIPEREPFTPTLPDNEYINLSERLQVNTVALAASHLSRVIQEETLGVYDYSKVTAFLDQKVKDLRMSSDDAEMRYSLRWGWFLIRPKPPGLYNHPNHKVDLSSIYDRPIPIEVLPTIDAILHRVPDALFFASDIYIYKDPFLAVGVPHSRELFVIERWDEPGFRS